MRGPFLTMAAILLALIYLSYRRNEVWRGGPAAVWQDSLNQSPKHLRPRLNLGVALSATDPTRAIAEFRTTIALARVAPEYEHPRNILLMAEANLGNLLIQSAEEAEARGDTVTAWSYYRDAAHVLERAWLDFPGSPFIGAHLSVLANVAGHPEIALNILDQALTSFPPEAPEYIHAALFWNKARALQLLHDCANAPLLYGLALKLDPDIQPLPACN